MHGRLTRVTRAERKMYWVSYCPEGARLQVRGTGNYTPRHDVLDCMVHAGQTTNPSLQFWSSANRPRHPKCLLPALFPGPEDPKSKVPDLFPITVLYLRHPSFSYSSIDLLDLPS